MAKQLMLNAQDGIVPPDAAALVRARKADLGTLPLNIPGTNCGNCQFYSPSQNSSDGSFGYCEHKDVAQPVTVRQCCAYWSAPGFLRV